ncbi:cilia- and flagella-associated protein 91 isoform X2 [Linepithema humile]|uniref:cilia- and flagella-associated protein 91 isoform X2 n=1 Tax=Linepithema humile TaxID=83485 RepID=UPI0006232E9A|nr:PREDICTED: protein MAATS1 isoform X1 [Linepithema humile]
MAVRSEAVGVTGESMYKRFRRPMIPFAAPKIQTADCSSPRYLEHKILSGILQSTRRQCYTASPKLEQLRNAETQTDYRESETQTEPWEPPYKVIPGHNPEILTLANLTWKHGLPAGIHEVHIINRMRMKRAWEAIAPPMDTPANIKMRSSIITALEVEEWAFRESEIQFIMDLRLNLMRNLLQDRESKYETKVRGRFNRLQDKLGKRRNDQVDTIRQNLKRNLRKLNKLHRDKQEPRKSDIIERLTDPKSDLYAPQMRLGEHSERRHETLRKRFLSESYIDREYNQFQFNINISCNYYYSISRNCCLEEEDTTLSWLPTIEEPKAIKSKPIDICIRETRWTEEKLEQLHSDLKAIRMNVKSVDVIPRLMKRKYKQSPLPVTPRRSGVWDSKQKQREESATFIQKFVRGRAIQCLMHEDRDRCKDFIRELQSTHARDQESQEKHQEERMYIELQRLRNEQSIQGDRLREILNSLEGKTVCGTLDFLSKKLMRLEDERRAHAFALLTEREKCMQEAAETDTQQQESCRREEFDKIFKQVAKINQDSVEAYLEDVISEGIDWISDKTAEEHVLELCDKADVIAKYSLDNANKLTEEELVADMIYNFILPEVEKHNIRRQIHDEQQNCMQNEKISDLSSSEPSLIMDQEICIKNKDVRAISVVNTELNIENEEIKFLIHKTDTEDKKQEDLETDLKSNFLIEDE